MGASKSSMPDDHNFAEKPVRSALAGRSQGATARRLDLQRLRRMASSDLRDQGFDIFAEDRFSEAVPYYDELVRRGEATGEDFNSRAECFHELQRYEKAIADFTECVRLGVDLANLGRAHAYSELKQYDKAIEDYSENVRLNPTESSAYLNLANAHFLVGAYVEALADLDQALSLQGSDTIPQLALWRRGVSLCHLGRYEEALRDFDRLYASQKKFLSMQLDHEAKTSPSMVGDFARFLPMLDATNSAVQEIAAAVGRLMRA